MKQSKIVSILLDFLHTETSWGKPLESRSEFEDLVVTDVTPMPDGSVSVAFEYHFDEDGFSQYDKTHTFRGKVKLDSRGRMVEKALEETHRGVATTKAYVPR